MTREEAIRWLEDIHRRFNPTGENLENEGGDVHLQALDMAIEALSAEAVEVVRCKDCRWAEKAILDEYCVECTMYHTSCMRPGYCHHGERREEDEQ